MVNHNHDRVKTINGGKVSDKVHKEILERARPLEDKGDGGWDYRVGEHLVCLADNTPRDIFLDVGGEAVTVGLFKDDRILERSKVEGSETNVS